MTTQKTFKRRVRERMAKTGESYASARANLLPAAAPEPDPAPPTRVHHVTGRTHEQWFALLDGAGAEAMTHAEIARWLAGEHGVPGWWAQNVTVEYERARGRRAVNQRADGFYAGVSKTVPVSVAELYAAAEARLGEWELSLRKANPPKSLRTDAPVGRPVIGFAPKGEAKAVIAVAHERLPDAEAVAHWKAVWRDRLAALAADLGR